MRISTAFLIVLTLSAFRHDGIAQNTSQGPSDFRNVFEEIQHGLETGNVAAFSVFFGSQVQVSLKGEESGYYSSGHTYYILEDFFKPRKVVSFEFTNVGETETMPYATGRAVFNNKGALEGAQVYVGLMRSGGKWVVTEINIY